LLVDLDVAEDHHDLVETGGGFLRVLDEQGAVQPEPDLRRRHHVRVIPEEARIAEHEVVGERAARLDLGCDTPGTPSIAIGIRRPCQCTVVGSGRALEKWTMRRSPTRARISGPGMPPL
jgi:hypothetical protein